MDYADVKRKWKEERAQLLKDKETMSWTELARKYGNAKSVLQRRVKRAQKEYVHPSPADTN